MRVARTLTAMRRVFAISDLHVDFKENHAIVEQWSQVKYKDDVLLLAGDVTDSLPLLRKTLEHMQSVFYKVFYVPGNHELWIRNEETDSNSLEKFYSIIGMCKELGIGTEPELIVLSEMDSIWIVPLFSWSATPEEDVQDSLYIQPQDPKTDIQSKQMWLTNFLCKWPDLGGTCSQYFSRLNFSACAKTYNKPVISFSHFLPRTDLIKPSREEIEEMDKERRKLGLGTVDEAIQEGKINPGSFNFSLYAGSKILESQIRKIGSSVHVFGHQHRNKDRTVEGVRYISHCLGYKRERSTGSVTGLNEFCEPKQIWPETNG